MQLTLREFRHLCRITPQFRSAYRRCANNLPLLNFNHVLRPISTFSGGPRDEEKDPRPFYPSEPQKPKTLSFVQNISNFPKPKISLIAQDSHHKVPISKLLKLLYPEKVYIGFSLIAITVAATSTMFFPTAIGQIIDLLNDAHTEENIAQMQQISLSMVGVFTIGAVATFAHTAMLEIVGQRVGARMRKRLFGHVMAQEIAFFDNNKAGELANRLSTDVHEVAEHLVENVARFLQNAIKAGTALGAMVFISTSLTFAASGVIPAVVGGAFFYGRYIKRLSRQHLDALASSTQIAAERFSAIHTVVSFAQTNREVDRYSSVIDRAYTLAKKTAVWEGAFLGTSYLVGNAALLGVLWLGGMMCMRDVLTAGALTSFCMYAGHLVESISDITESVAGFLRAQGSGARLFGLLERRPEVKSGTLILPPSYQPYIKFDNVTFGYDSAQDVLKGFSLDIKPGEIVAITGASGCGKSSVANILERLYDGREGRILLAGEDIQNLDVDWLRGQIGTVKQEPTLFAGTIRENIAYTNLTVNQQQIEEAAKLAHIHDFIAALPHAYDTVLGERGVSLSGGQRQRLAIARALVSSPKILVWDEATSALDTATEALIHETLEALVRDHSRSALVIAHHTSTLKHADRVVVLDHGKVVQDGPFSELIVCRGSPLNLLLHAKEVHTAHVHDDEPATIKKK